MWGVQDVTLYYVKFILYIHMNWKILKFYAKGCWDTLWTVAIDNFFRAVALNTPCCRQKQKWDALKSIIETPCRQYWEQLATLARVIARAETRGQTLTNGPDVAAADPGHVTRAFIQTPAGHNVCTPHGPLKNCNNFEDKNLIDRRR